MDGPDGGVFTQQLVAAVEGGPTRQSWAELRDLVAGYLSDVGQAQVPQLLWNGPGASALARCAAFG